MEEAKQAVEAFMAKAGHHDTTVVEKVAPAVYHETITKDEYEEILTAVEKEIHQDHFHISVQPVTDEETLPDQHHNNVIEIDHRSIAHEDIEEVHKRRAEEHAQFKDEIIRINGKKTDNILPIIAGEHIHHHVHETIQPVVTKSTLESHIIHTLIPIHEHHRNVAHHHVTSSLPTVTMAEYKRQFGALTGREERYDFFQGEPRSKALAGGSNASSQPTSAGPAGIKGGSTDRNNTATGSAPAPAPNSQPEQPTASSSSAAPAQPTGAPPAPPLPPQHPSNALMPRSTGIGHLMSPPTFIPPHIYQRGHPTVGLTPGGQPTGLKDPATDKPLPDRP